ncbi:MAG: YceI family protein [Phycisphaerales bacterium]|nr:YceI family protein [Phycisphaerales bacterium]
MRQRLLALPATGLLLAGAWLVTQGPEQTAEARPASSAALSAFADHTYTVDSVHSGVVFRIMHMGASPFWGRINDPSGTINFDPDDLASASFDVSVKVDNIYSGNDKRDTHLKSNDFFAAKQFPSIAFKSDSVKKGDKPGMYTLTGELDLHGVKKPITAHAEWFGRKDSGRGVKAGFEVTFTIQRSDFGMTTYIDEGGLGDEVKLICGFELNG